MLADAAEGAVVASTKLANVTTGGEGGARVALSRWSFLEFDLFLEAESLESFELFVSGGVACGERKPFLSCRFAGIAEVGENVALCVKR